MRGSPVRAGALPGGAPEARARHGIARERLDRGGDRLVVSGGHESRRAVPELAEGRDVGQDQGATRLCGLQHREPEGLVVRDGNEDRTGAQAASNFRVAQGAKRANELQRDGIAVRAPLRARGEMNS